MAIAGACALDLDPVFVGAYHFLRFMGLSLLVRRHPE
jgi:hypothetical protein